MPSRRQVIEAAVAKASGPSDVVIACGEAGAKTRTHGDAFDAALRVSSRAGAVGPGGMTHVFNMAKKLAPERRQHAINAIVALESERDFGRHADPAGVAKRYGVDQELLEAATDGFEVDFVCSKLQERKSDADLSIPAVTRHDVIEAAFDSATKEN